MGIDPHKVVRNIHWVTPYNLQHKMLHKIIRYIHRITQHNIRMGKISFNMKYVEHASTLDKSLHKYVNYEPWLSKKITETLNRDDVVCDIGAYRGYYSLLFNELVSSPKNIYSFEPDPYNSKLLKKNIAKTRLIRKYVSDVDDHENVSLDNLFDNNSSNVKPTVLKIDIDGGEIQLIRGGRKFLEKCRPKIFMEIHPIQIKKIEEKGVEELFEVLFVHYKIMQMKNHWGRMKGYDAWNNTSTHVWEEVDKDFLIRYCNDIIEDNIYRKAAIYNNTILPRGFAIFCG